MRFRLQLLDLPHQTTESNWIDALPTIQIVSAPPWRTQNDCSHSPLDRLGEIEVFGAGETGIGVLVGDFDAWVTNMSHDPSISHVVLPSLRLLARVSDPANQNQTGTA